MKHGLDIPRHSSDQYPRRQRIATRTIAAIAVVGIAGGVCANSTDIGAYMTGFDSGIPAFGCPDIDDTRIDVIEQQIKSIYDGTYAGAQSPVETGGSDLVDIVAENPVNPEYAALQIRDYYAPEVLQSEEFQPTYSAVVTALNTVPVELLAASNIDRLVLFDGANDATAGIFITASADSIYVNGELIEAYPDSRAALSTIAHELGHAVVWRLCGVTLTPPVEYTSINPDTFLYGTSTESLTSETGIVSTYGGTSSVEDIAEMYSAIFGSHDAFISPSLTLDTMLANDDEAFQDKAAVAIAMLEKLDPALVDIALSRLNDRYNAYVVSSE